MVRTILETVIPERSTRRYRCTLLDSTGSPVPKASVSSLHMTLTNLSTNTIINGRELTDVLSGLHDTSGALSITLTAEDNQICNPRLALNAIERHLLQLHVVFNGGEEWHEAELKIQNLRRVP